jgi:hypothetical protein
MTLIYLFNRMSHFIYVLSLNKIKHKHVNFVFGRQNKVMVLGASILPIVA